MRPIIKEGREGWRHGEINADEGNQEEMPGLLYWAGE